MKIAVLGCHSFAGSWLVKSALDKGFKVLGINRSELSHNIFCAFRGHLTFDNFSFLQADINNDLDKVLEKIKMEQPEIIVDFAGQGMVSPSWETPEQWYQTNLISKVKIVNSLLGQSWLKGYIRVSTPEVYGPTSGKVNENTVYAPSTPYAISHAAIDSHMMSFHLHRDFPLMLGRFANFYGEHQQLYRIIPRALYCAISEEILNLEGGGYSVRAFIHAEDVSRGILSMIEKGKLGEIYHFSTDEHVSIRDLVGKISSITGNCWDSFVKEAPDRLGKDAAYKLSCKKAFDELGWKANITLQEGLTRCFDWIQNNKNIIDGLDKSYVHKI